MFMVQKKEWSHTGFHSLLRVAFHKSHLLQSRLPENKKVPKDCHAASEKSSVLPDAGTAPDTNYNHKQRMHPGSCPIRQLRNLRLTKDRQTYRVCPAPPRSP